MRLIRQFSSSVVANGTVNVVAGTYSEGDIAVEVQRRGYKSNSANFRGIVNQTLIKEKQFAQASRGMYQLKK